MERDDGGTYSALLNLLDEDGRMKDEAVRELEDMKRKIEDKKLLEGFERKSWQGKDGRWRAYIYEDGKRKMLVKPTREELDVAIIEYCRKEQAEKETFLDSYRRWRKAHDVSLSDNSIRKYDSDYERYLMGTDFETERTAEITEEDVEVFITKTVRRLSLCRKAAKTLYGYLFNTFKSACINRVISENPMRLMEPKQFYRFCTERKRPKERNTVSDEDMERLYERFYRDYEEHPEYVPTRAVEFATLTGMRVGEISGLMWSDIDRDSGRIMICRSEKYDKIKKKYFISATKNGKVRAFPITYEIGVLLDAVRNVEEKYGFLCEWVFANAKGRIHASVISSCCKNKCRQAGITEQGIHAFRRTLNSKMRCAGAPPLVTSSLLGNTEQVNDRYYTFDITAEDDRMRAVESVNSRMPRGGRKSP